MAGDDKLPKTHLDWAECMKTFRHLPPNVSPFKFSLDGVKRLASASVLKFEDWLLLRILSILDEQVPTPTLILGSYYGPKLEKECREYLEKQSWWRAVQSRSAEPKDWCEMALWKKVALDIAARSKVIQYETPEYDLENLFMYKITVEPASGSTPGLTPEPVPRPAAIAGQNTRLTSDVTIARIAKEHDFETDVISPVGNSNYSPGNVSISSVSHRLAKRPPDEALVNKSVIDLLQGICMDHPAIKNKYNWSVIHQTFHVLQQRETKEKVMTSQTDGCLQVEKEGALLENCCTLAIVEAKPVRRKIKQGAISRQEGAEMAAWISTESLRGRLPESTSGPNRIMRRVLISQDLDEICITVAEYDKEYVDYITNGFKSAEMNSTQSSPTTNVQSRRNQEQGQQRPQGQKRPQGQAQQGGEKRHKGDESDGENDDDESDEENDDDERDGDDH